MRRVAAVARREFLERMRSKAFLVATVLGPLLLGGLMLLLALVMAGQRGHCAWPCSPRASPEKNAVEGR